MKYIKDKLVSIEKDFKIIQYLLNNPDGLPLKEISRKLGINYYYVRAVVLDCIKDYYLIKVTQSPMIIKINPSYYNELKRFNDSLKELLNIHNKQIAINNLKEKDIRQEDIY